MHFMQRFTIRNLRVFDLILLALLLVFLTEARHLAEFVVMAAFFVFYLGMRQRLAAAISRQREAIAVALSIPVAAVAVVSYRLTGNEMWALLVVVGIGVSLLVTWMMLGDQMPSRQERRDRKQSL